MPELPEVETVARGLSAVLPGKTITSATLSARDLYRRGSRRIECLKGGRIESVERIGKAIRFLVDTPGRIQERVLVVHLGMTGRLVLPDRNGKAAGSGSNKHRHARMKFEDGHEVWYIDPRRFGYFYIGVPENLRENLNIGLDPFEMDIETFRLLLASRSAPIKSVLLNQKIISGLGNIYVDELLYLTRMHPLVPAQRASRRATDILANSLLVLNAALKRGGTTLRDYRQADGSKGSYQTKLNVYGREGSECPRCGSLIRRIVISARSSHFCPRCQRVPRRI